MSSLIWVVSLITADWRSLFVRTPVYLPACVRWVSRAAPLTLTDRSLDEYCHRDRKFTHEIPHAVIALTFEREAGSGVVLARRGAHHPRHCSWQSSHHVATRNNNKKTRTCCSCKVQVKRGLMLTALQNWSAVKLQSLAENWEKSPPTTGERMLSSAATNVPKFLKKEITTTRNEYE